MLSEMFGHQFMNFSFLLQHKRPVYIRDFIEGMNDKEMDMEKFQIYLNTLYSLIRKSEHEVKEVRRRCYSCGCSYI